MTFPRFESTSGEVLGIGLTIEEAERLLEVLAAYAVADHRRPPAELFARELRERVGSWLRQRNLRRERDALASRLADELERLGLGDALGRLADEAAP